MALKQLSNSKSPIFTAYSKVCRKFCTSQPKLPLEQVKLKRNSIFDKEKARQLSLITRVEKIKVNYKGPPENCTLIMNKNLSTPYNCAMHIQEAVTLRSVLALVNGVPWDMHRPLEEDCDITFEHFKQQKPVLANRVFWRTGSFILGYVIENTFKDNVHVELCSFPSPNVHTGSFVYDTKIHLDNWTPTQTELRLMSKVGGRLAYQKLKFERLEVDGSIAEQMFEDNRFKLQQIPSIAAQSPKGHSVVLYRMGDHIDITRGPLMANSFQLNRFDVTGMHQIESADFGKLTRVQGLAMPKDIPVHFSTYNFLSKRAAKLNTAPLPQLYGTSKTQKEVTDS